MKLPVVSGNEAVTAFRKVGYEFDEQHGSHMILRHAHPPYRRLSVNHNELAKGTLRAFGGRVRRSALINIAARTKSGLDIPCAGVEFESRLEG